MGIAFPARLGSGAKASIDVAMAGFAALAVGFVFVAMPGELFASLIGATGLAAIVPAAEPPLGDTARIAVALAAAAATFLASWLVLRALSKPRPRVVTFTAADPVAPPRLRRADSHPDAPARHPILAGRDFGAFGEPEIAEPEIVEPEVAEPEVDQPEIARTEVAVDAAPLDLIAEAILGSPPVKPASPPTRPDDSLDALVARLERGLTAVPRAQPAPASTPTPMPMPRTAPDDRLQNAIDDLQRLARRGA